MGEAANILETINNADSILHLETERIKRDGTVIPVSLTVSPVRNPEGKIFCASVISRDITQRKQAEAERQDLEQQLRQVQKLEAIGNLAGGIAHDFNNILSPIIGYTEMALMGMDETLPLYRDLEQVLGAGLRAKELTKQILTFARKTENRKEPVRISLIVKEALKLLRASLPSTIEIRQGFSPGTEQGCVMGDPTQIHQILMNLCTNAGHAMRTDGGILGVRLAKIEIGKMVAAQHDAVPGPYLELSVSDSGHGMTEEVKQRIFDPYFTTKGKGEGTGLGLAVVYGIVRDLGGFIYVDSKPGVGTTFRVFLPLSTEKDYREDASPLVLPVRSGRVLFVDDETVLVEMGRRMLERLGYDVTAVSSSLKALDLFREGPDRFDLVITDQTMPYMTGAHLAREILAVRRDIPVILYTGFSEAISEEKAKSIGIREILMKPLTLNSLSCAIQRIHK